VGAVEYSYVLISAISGVMIGLLYALVGLSLTFIFGVLQFVNSAHGHLMMVGAYIAFWLFVLYGWPPLVSLIIASLLGLAFGVALYALVVRKLMGLPALYSLSAAFALGIFIQELAKVLWGPSYRGFLYDMGSIKIFDYVVPATRVWGSIISALFVFLVYYYLYKTKSGRAIRSIIQNPEGSVLSGVDIYRFYSLALAVSIALNVASGCLLTLYVSSGINPYMGGIYTDLAFMVAVTGGLGAPEGALIAGLIYGLIENMIPTVLSGVQNISLYPATRFIMFVILLIVLLVRPRGIMGR
jgi:branched-chain amino acid transport system permease protein